MNKKVLIKHFIAAILSLFGLVFFLIAVNPEDKPLFYIFVPVVLVWIFLFMVSQIIIAIIFKEKSRIKSILSVSIVSAIVLLLLLSGLNQLTVADIILSTSLVLVASFYFYRMWS